MTVNILTLAAHLQELGRTLPIPVDRETCKRAAHALLDLTESQLLPTDKFEAVRLIRVGIESGLLRDGFDEQLGCPDGWERCSLAPGWTPATFAEERARNIFTALLGEFRFTRLSDAIDSQSTDSSSASAQPATQDTDEQR